MPHGSNWRKQEAPAREPPRFKRPSVSRLLMHAELAAKRQHPTAAAVRAALRYAAGDCSESHYEEALVAAMREIPGLFGPEDT